VYVDGNLEINNFNPFNRGPPGGDLENELDHDDDEEDDDVSDENDRQLDVMYDFSFLDNIKEITGYLLIHNTRIKNLTFKNLKLIRGKNLVSDLYSVYIDSNSRLTNLDLSNLRGTYLIDNLVAWYYMSKLILRPK
jgi:hypothetical protein